MNNSNGNYPTMSQSELSNAPWNQENLEPQKIKVTVSITLSKTVEVEVTDYDYSECNLEQAVRDQVILPNSVGEFNDWVEDDFAVIKEED